MSFIAAKVFWFVAEPPHFILIAFVVAGLLRLTRWRRSSGPIAAAAATLYGAIIVLPLGSWLMMPLEDRFPPPASPPATVDGIIVLGGAVEPRLSLLRGQPQLNDSGERMLAMIELARLYPQAKLVFTGGSGRLVDTEAREADTAKDLMTRVGLPPERVTYERDSRDTTENAIMSKAIVQPRLGETWLLVTSAWHMPRAVGVFRRVGWPVVAWPVDYASEGDWGFRINVSGLEGQRRFKVALREWIGLIAYRLMSRTDQLFPAP